MKPDNMQNTEHADPYEQNNPVPKVVMGLALALVVWASSYIFLEEATNGIAELGDMRDPATLVAATASSQAVDGAQIYTANCLACHQASGQGLPGVFPPLANSEWVNEEPATLIQIMLHGMTGAIEVAGTTYNGAMPAFGAQLSDAEIAAVTSHIRSQWGNNATAIEADAVAAARTASEGQDEPWHGQDGLTTFMLKAAVQ